MQDDKKQTLKYALEKIEKTYGKGSVMRMGDYVSAQKDIAQSINSAVKIEQMGV